jgi:hypothetical protein
MNFYFRRAIRRMAIMSGVISFQVNAAVEPPESSPITKVISESGRSVDYVAPEAGILISLVLIALVLIARRIKHHD